MSGRYGLAIRAATAADVPGLCELMADCGLPVAADRLGARLDALTRGGQGGGQGGVQGGSRGAVLVAADWGPPCGVVAVGWERSLRADGGVARLDTLLVAPDDRRRGIGRLLLKAASQSARQAGCDTLVAAADATLLAFLAATGFAPAGETHARPLRRRG